MKLTIIWTVPAMTLRERVRRTVHDWLPRTVAAHLPHSVQYWATIHTACRALGPHDVVPDLRVMEVLERTGGSHVS